MAILQDNSGNVAGATKFGGGFGVRERTASQFTPGANWNVTSVDIRANEDTGDPGGNASSNYDIIIAILGDTGSNLPNNSDVKGTVTLAHNAVNSGATFVDVTATFASSVSLTSGTKYWVVYRVVGSGDDSNYYSCRAIITAGTGAKYDEDGSGAWAAATQDLYYKINGSATTGYTLTAAVGTFTLTGVASSLLKSLKMVGAVGSYTLTGIAATLRRGYSVVASTGAFVLTGVDVALRKALTMAGAAGSFVLTGVAAGLKIGYNLVAGVGSYVLTGISARFSMIYTRIAKNSTSYSTVNKNSTSYSTTSKNTTTYTEVPGANP